MGINEKNPGPSVQDISAPQRDPSQRIGGGFPPLKTQDKNFPQGGRHQLTPISVNYTPQSSSLSLGSNRISGNYIPRTSSSSLASNAIQANVSSAETKAQRSYNPPVGYQGYDERMSGGYGNEPSQSQQRAGYGPQQYFTQPPEDRRSDDYDGDDSSEENTFVEKSVRRAFVQKVYLLIMCMMIFASGVISFMMFHQPTRKYILRHMWLVIVSWALYPVLMMILICCQRVRRTVPWNYIVLFILTLALSFMAGCSAARFDKYEVLGAFGITAVLCLGLTLFAFQTKWDFTVISGGLVVASLVMLIFGIVLIFWRNKIAMIGYSCLGALLGCFFFIFDTQMIVGGNHRYAINPEEYVFAAITLFSDMINIFIMVMNIIGLSRS